MPFFNWGKSFPPGKKQKAKIVRKKPIVVQRLFVKQWDHVLLRFTHISFNRSIDWRLLADNDDASSCSSETKIIINTRSRKPPSWKPALCGPQMTSSGLLMHWRPCSWLVHGASPDESKPIRSRFIDVEKSFVCVKQTLILTRFEQFLVKTNSFRKENQFISIVINWKTQGKHLNQSWEKAKSRSTRRRYKESTFLSSYEKRNSNIIHLNWVSPNEQN